MKLGEIEFDWGGGGVGGGGLFSICKEKMLFKS